MKRKGPYWTELDFNYLCHWNGQICIIHIALFSLLVDRWKTEINPQTAAAFYRIDLLEAKEGERRLRPILDLCEDQQSQTSSIISFYKGVGVDWARPLDCVLHGNSIDPYF